MKDPLKRIRLDAENLPWRLERRVPLALIFAGLLQIVALVAWATWLEARLATVEQAQRDNHGMDAQFARLEERLAALRDEMIVMRRQVEKLGERRP